MIRTFVIAILLVSLMGCNKSDTGKTESNKAEIQQSFDMSSIPCGILKSGTMPHLIIEQDDGKLVDIIVPDWVWESFIKKGGERIGNCEEQPEQAPAADASSEEQNAAG